MDNSKEILIQQTLEEQQGMTAVEQFAFKKDFCQIPQEVSRYKELIPKTTPGPGQQYAFEVNLDQCSGCKACVTACHNENGLEEDETWRSVGLIHGLTPEGPAIQHVTSACHHCLEPACMHGCPVKAYEKDPITGVVKHLDDQCIGCQYCILKCPYDVPKYNKKKGIVHKCDMCISRLKKDEAPACVRACPNEAIRIALIDVAAVRANPSVFVNNIPQAPDSSYTMPTTRYLTRKTLPASMTSLDASSFEPEHPHMPLVFMLVLTQLSVGTFVVGHLINSMIQDSLRSALSTTHVMVALGMGLLALASSIFHLGRPLYAFRAILGIKTSWLSREILAFGLFANLAIIYAVQIQFHFIPSALLTGSLSIAVLLSGLAGVYASVMVYRDTHRVLWDTPMTAFKFFMTTVILGAVTSMLVSLSAASMSEDSFADALRSIGIPLVQLTIALSLVKLIVEASLFSHLRSPVMSELKKSALLMTGALRMWTTCRFVLGVIGGILMPALFLVVQQYMNVPQVICWVWGMALLTVAAEILERYLFFRAVIPLRMPH